MRFQVHLRGIAGKESFIVELQRSGNAFAFRLDGQTVPADVVLQGSNTVSVLLNGRSYEFHIAPSSNGALKLQSGPDEFLAEVEDPRAWRGRKHGPQELAGLQHITAPMPGKVIRLLVSAGDHVQAAQGLVVVEAMKMQNEIRSPKTGKVQRLLVKEGQAVNAGQVLVWVE